MTLSQPSRDQQSSAAQSVSSKLKSYAGPVISVLVLLATCYYFIGTYPADDPWITFRYSRNLVDGHGLVYNPGDERVEGYTNFLWMIVMALSIAVEIPPTVFTVLIGVPLVLGTAFALYKVFRRTCVGVGNDEFAWLPILLLAMMVPYAIWAFAGLETPLTGLLIILLLLSRCVVNNKNSRAFIYGILSVLLLLDRSDGAIVVLGVALFVITEWFTERPRHLTPLVVQICLILAPIVILYVPYFIWRYDYFGYLFPNTYYAKLDGLEIWVRAINGLRYFLSSITGWMLIPLVLVVLLPIIDRHSLSNPFIRFAYILVSLRLALILYSGGDVLPFARFFVPIIPLIALVSAYSLVRFGQLVTRKGLRRYLVVAIYISAHLVATVETLDTSNLLDSLLEGGSQLELDSKIASISEPRCPFCLWLRDYAPENASIALFRAGFVPFYTDFFTIDRIGLNNVYIAHAGQRDPGRTGVEFRNTLEYWLEQQPTFIETNLNRVQLIAFGDAGISSNSAEDIELFSESAFINSYALLVIEGPYQPIGTWFQRLDTLDPACLRSVETLAVPICSIIQETQ